MGPYFLQHLDISGRMIIDKTFGSLLSVPRSKKTHGTFVEFSDDHQHLAVVSVFCTTLFIYQNPYFARSCLTNACSCGKDFLRPATPGICLLTACRVLFVSFWSALAHPFLFQIIAPDHSGTL